jgi:RNA-binding protein YlmH
VLSISGLHVLGTDLCGMRKLGRDSLECIQETTKKEKALLFR